MTAPCCGRVSTVLGGVKVHGYTDFVTATNYLLWASVDDEADDGKQGNRLLAERVPGLQLHKPANRRASALEGREALHIRADGILALPP